jgi:hypothetical protein
MVLLNLWQVYFQFFKNLHTVFHSGGTSLHSFPPTVYEGSYSLHPCQCLLLFVLLMVAILTEVMWNLNVNLSLNDVYLFSVLVIIHNEAMNNVEVEFLCIYNLHKKFHYSVPTRTIFFLHCKPVGSNLCTFHLTQISYLAKIMCLCRDGWHLYSQSNPGSQVISVKTEAGFVIKPQLPMTGQLDLAKVFGISNAHLSSSALYPDIQR